MVSSIVFVLLYWVYLICSLYSKMWCSQNLSFAITCFLYVYIVATVAVNICLRDFHCLRSSLFSSLSTFSISSSFTQTILLLLLLLAVKWLFRLCVCYKKQFFKFLKHSNFTEKLDSVVWVHNILLYSGIHIPGVSPRGDLVPCKYAQKKNFSEIFWWEIRKRFIILYHKRRMMLHESTGYII